MDEENDLIVAALVGESLRGTLGGRHDVHGLPPFRPIRFTRACIVIAMYIR